MFELIFLSLLSFVFFAFAYQLCIKSRITLIHSYHYKRVPVQMYKPYTFVMGIAMLFLGLAELSFSVLKFVGLVSLAVPVLLTGIGLGLGIFVIAQYKYNGGIF